MGFFLCNKRVVRLFARRSQFVVLEGSHCVVECSGEDGSVILGSFGLIRVKKVVSIEPFSFECSLF